LFLSEKNSEVSAREICLEEERRKVFTIEIKKVKRKERDKESKEREENEK